MQETQKRAGKLQKKANEDQSNPDIDQGKVILIVYDNLWHNFFNEM